MEHLTKESAHSCIFFLSSMYHCFISETVQAPLLWIDKTINEIFIIKPHN